MTKKKITTTVTEEIVEDGPKRTHVAIVLDASASMDRLKSDTIGGFNRLVRELKEIAVLGGETTISLVTFGEPPNGGVKVKLLGAAVDQIKELDDKKYVPYGNTRLLDGIGTTLEALQGLSSNGDVAYRVTIITDGEENDSREWTGPSIYDKIKSLEATGRWTIDMIGASVHQLEKMRKHYGINQVIAFDPSKIGTQLMYAGLQGATQSYFAGRSVGATNMPNVYNGNTTFNATSSASLSAKGAEDVAAAMEAMKQSQMPPKKKKTAPKVTVEA